MGIWEPAVLVTLRAGYNMILKRCEWVIKKTYFFKKNPLSVDFMKDDE